MEITYQDFNNICRVCLKGDPSELEDFELMLLQLYKHLICMPPHQNMEGPRHICKVCASYLQNVLGFQSQCMKNEAIILTLSKCAKQPDLPLDINDYEIESGDTEEKIIDLTAEGDDGATTKLESKAAPENSQSSELMQPHLNAMQPTLKTSVLEENNIHETPQELPTQAVPISYLSVKTDLIGTERTISNEIPNHNTQPKRQDMGGISSSEVPNHKTQLQKQDVAGTSSNEVPNHKTQLQKQDVGGTSSKIRNPKTRPKKQKFDITNKNLTCMSCTLSYETPAGLQAHFALGCDKSFQQYMSNPQHLSGRQLFKCGMCSKPFGITSFAEHLAVKHRTFTYQCTYCGKRFNKAHKLQNHVYMLHTHQKAFRCSICHKEYVAKSLLEKHLTKSGHRAFNLDAMNWVYFDGSRLSGVNQNSLISDMGANFLSQYQCQKEKVVIELAITHDTGTVDKTMLLIVMLGRCELFNCKL